MKFLRCNHCGNIVTYIDEKACIPSCCGEQMEVLAPNTTDAANEKHVPVCNVEGNVVNVVVGSVEHPMLEEHSIQWIAVETNKGAQIKYLKPGEKPAAQFVLAEGEEVVHVYEYCNLHGLWMA